MKWCWSRIISNSMLNFASVTVVQSVFQGRQHHVNTGPAAVTSHKSHTQHLGGAKTRWTWGHTGLSSDEQWRSKHVSPGQQRVRALQRSLNCASSWCSLWSPSSRIREEQRWWWPSAVSLSGTTTQVRTPPFCISSYNTLIAHHKHSLSLWQKVWDPCSPGWRGNTRPRFCVSPTSFPDP